MFPFLHTQTVTESAPPYQTPRGDHPFYPHTSQHWFSSLSDSRCHVSQLMGLCRPISKNCSLFSQLPFLYVLNSIEQCHKVLTESEFRKIFFFPLIYLGGWWFLRISQCTLNHVSGSIILFIVVVVSLSLFLSLFRPFFFFLVAGLHRTNLHHNWHGHVRRA